MARCLVFTGLWLVFSTALAQQTPGTDVVSAVQSCAACHGPEGQGVDPYPRLAGLGQAYLKRQLDSFADGDRINAIMKPIASDLSAEQRQQIARHFSELPVQPDDSAGVDDTENHPGRILALHGRWQEDLPACVQCHGPGGRGIGESFPSLAGQPASYLEDQLKAWRSGQRKAGPMGLMGHIAERLDEEDLKAVAEYFASLSAVKEAGDE
ncbi:MAG: cytochrome c4 [Alcanivorax sp.]|nr:cytochrome c4 [Alcanivorax sp.]